jgi:hypothetical protein
MVKVDVRPTQKLRGSNRLDVAASLGPVFSALSADSVDLERVRLVCDWIQYRSNFRDVVDLRPVLPSATNGGSSAAVLELAIDLRRTADIDVESTTRQILADQHNSGLRRVYLEDWVAGRDSCIWSLNSLYWQALGHWEKTTGQEYEQALPGGESDARNRSAVRKLLLDLFHVWDDLGARSALPEELYVVELGVGNGNQAKVWLDEFAALDRADGRDYYRRLHYILGDYSPHVLRRAERTVADHVAHTSSIVLDATQPLSTLGFLRHKAFLIYVSNVYDNLPTDEIAYISGRAHLVEVRAVLRDKDAERIAREATTTPNDLPMLVEKLVRLGPDLLSEVQPQNFPSVESAIEFWRACWTALRLEERYAPLDGLDLYEIAPGLTGEHLRPLLERHGDLRLHVSNGAVASFAGTLPLLHPFGRLQCHDLFVTDTDQYLTGFYGPGKYDGSVVNWVNGPLLRHVGSRQGFDITFTPFGHGARTHVKTLTASLHD